MQVLRGSVIDVVIYVGMAWRVAAYSNTLTQEFVDRLNSSGFRVLNVDDGNLSIFSGGSLRVRVEVLTDGYASELDAASVVSGAASAAGYNATSFMGSVVSSGAGEANTMHPGGSSGQSYDDPNRPDESPFADYLEIFTGDSATVFGVLAFALAAVVLLRR